MAATSVNLPPISLWRQNEGDLLEKIYTCIQNPAAFPAHTREAFVKEIQSLLQEAIPLKAIPDDYTLQVYTYFIQKTANHVWTDKDIDWSSLQEYNHLYKRTLTGQSTTSQATEMPPASSSHESARPSTEPVGVGHGRAIHPFQVGAGGVNQGPIGPDRLKRSLHIDGTDAHQALPDRKRTRLTSDVKSEPVDDDVLLPPATDPAVVPGASTSSIPSPATSHATTIPLNQPRPDLTSINSTTTLVNGLPQRRAATAALEAIDGIVKKETSDDGLGSNYIPVEPTPAPSRQKTPGFRISNKALLPVPLVINPHCAQCVTKDEKAIARAKVKLEEPPPPVECKISFESQHACDGCAKSRIKCPLVQQKREEKKLATLIQKAERKSTKGKSKKGKGREVEVVVGNVNRPGPSQAASSSVADARQPSLERMIHEHDSNIRTLKSSVRELQEFAQFSLLQEGSFKKDIHQLKISSTKHRNHLESLETRMDADSQLLSDLRKALAAFRIRQSQRTSASTPTAQEHIVDEPRDGTAPGVDIVKEGFEHIFGFDPFLNGAVMSEQDAYMGMDATGNLGANFPDLTTITNFGLNIPHRASSENRIDDDLGSTTHPVQVLEPNPSRRRCSTSSVATASSSVAGDTRNLEAHEDDVDRPLPPSSPPPEAFNTNHGDSSVSDNEDDMDRALPPSSPPPEAVNSNDGDSSVSDNEDDMNCPLPPSSPPPEAVNGNEDDSSLSDTGNPTPRSSPPRSSPMNGACQLEPSECNTQDVKMASCGLNDGDEKESNVINAQVNSQSQVQNGAISGHESDSPNPPDPEVLSTEPAQEHLEDIAISPGLQAQDGVPSLSGDGARERLPPADASDSPAPQDLEVLPTTGGQEHSGDVGTSTAPDGCPSQAHSSGSSHGVRVNSSGLFAGGGSGEDVLSAANASGLPEPQDPEVLPTIGGRQHSENVGTSSMQQAQDADPSQVSGEAPGERLVPQSVSDSEDPRDPKVIPTEGGQENSEDVGPSSELPVQHGRLSQASGEASGESLLSRNVSDSQDPRDPEVTPLEGGQENSEDVEPSSELQAQDGGPSQVPGEARGDSLPPDHDHNEPPHTPSSGFPPGKDLDSQLTSPRATPPPTPPVSITIATTHSRSRSRSVEPSTRILRPRPATVLAPVPERSPLKKTSRR